LAAAFGQRLLCLATSRAARSESCATRSNLQRSPRTLSRPQERDTERLNNVELENRVQSLLEEIEFLKNVHDQELKELMALSTQDSYAQNRKYWEGEMSNAIRELQQEFDRRVDQHTSQLENYYQMKVSDSVQAAPKSCHRFPRRPPTPLRSDAGLLRVSVNHSSPAASTWFRRAGRRLNHQAAQRA